MSADIRCPRCTVEYPTLDDFPVDRSRLSGRYPYCKPCATELQAEWRAKNPEKYRAGVKRRIDRIKATHAP